MFMSSNLSTSGVSSGNSEFSVKAGLLSAPEASEKAVSSKGLRGVVKAGFRNGGAVLLLCILGEKSDVWGRAVSGLEGLFAKRFGLEGLANGFGLELANLLGDLKTAMTWKDQYDIP